STGPPGGSASSRWCRTSCSRSTSEDVGSRSGGRTMTDALPALEIEILTLFPELFDGILSTTVLGKAVASGLVAVHRTNPRDFGPARSRQAADPPYGGGPGMIMRVEPIAAALEAVTTARGPSHVILMTPQGRVLDQQHARELAQRRRLTLVCGRYE